MCTIPEARAHKHSPVKVRSEDRMTVNLDRCFCSLGNCHSWYYPLDDARGNLTTTTNDDERKTSENL